MQPMWYNVVTAVSYILVGLAATVGIIEFALVPWLRSSYYHALFPALQLKLDARVAPNDKGIVLISAQIKNASKAVVFLPDTRDPEEKKFRPTVVIREEDLSKLGAGESFSDFLAFTEPDYEKRKGQLPLAPSFQPPYRCEGLLTSSKTVEPGEVISIEFPYRPRSQGAAIHCAFQVHAKLPKFAQFLYASKDEPWPARFTTVTYALGPNGNE